MTYFRTCGHYHRLQEFNGRVRNGNAWDPLYMITRMHLTGGKADQAIYCIGN